MVVDPIFKTGVPEMNSRYKKGYHGKIYYFCAPCTKKLFEEHPDKYVEG